jgi:Fe-S-cluster containining protein
VQLGPYDGTAYVYLDPEETRRMRRLGLLVVNATLGARCLGAAPHKGAGRRPACVAFAGELGRQCSCAIYEDRPAVCREFEVGSQLCRDAREQARLPV